MPADNTLKRKVASLEAEAVDLNAKVASLETDAADLTQLLHQCQCDSSEVESLSESDWSGMERSGTTWSVARSSSFWSEENLQKAKMSIYFNDSADHAAVTQDNEMQTMRQQWMVGGQHLKGPLHLVCQVHFSCLTLVCFLSCMLAWKCRKLFGHLQFLVLPGQRSWL